MTMLPVLGQEEVAMHGEDVHDRFQDNRCRAGDHLQLLVVDDGLNVGPGTGTPCSPPPAACLHPEKTIITQPWQVGHLI